MNYQEVHYSLLNWYEQNGRHNLPWRNTSDPYHIYVSEIMLQQTQVKTVLGRFYFPFLEAFPTITDLASASLDDVLKKWEGLGYYTRARNLHKAAQLCSGILPKTAQELLLLPGIGRSTAHAIACFAYGEQVPILDANVKRILHRFYAIQERTETLLWDAAYRLFDSKNSYAYNQVMMDLGSSICTQRNPLCEVCPLLKECMGKDAPHNFPKAIAKKQKPINKKIIIIHERNKKIALYQRTTKFLHKLWGFEEVDTLKHNNELLLGDITQQYSHFTLTADIYLNTDFFNDELFEWFDIEEITQLSLSKADHKILELYKKHLTHAYNMENSKE